MFAAQRLSNKFVVSLHRKVDKYLNRILIWNIWKLVRCNFKATNDGIVRDWHIFAFKNQSERLTYIILYFQFIIIHDHHRQILNEGLPKYFSFSQPSSTDFFHSQPFFFYKTYQFRNIQSSKNNYFFLLVFFNTYFQIFRIFHLTNFDIRGQDIL